MPPSDAANKEAVPAGGWLYTPQHPASMVDQLRALHAGDRARQNQLAQDDRYWFGRDAGPVAGLAALVSSGVYDGAKLAYFYGPQGVREPLERLTKAVLPRHAFNPQTTSQPTWGAYRALLQGIWDGVEAQPPPTGRK